jgi:alkanesulfonate monooxygenase SsuD/methylene tetrahydromethanopterin reductase-like flavin-dependent oxidoreductase (luciferase family)
VRRIVPIVLGDNSDAALARAARCGDGWCGFNLPGVDEVRERVEVLHARTREAGGDPAALEAAVAVTDAEPANIPALTAAGSGTRGRRRRARGPGNDARAWARAHADRWLRPDPE